MTPGNLQEKLRARLEVGEFSDVLAVFLFGSEAQGRAHAESDVDLGVLLDRAAHPSARERFDRRLVLVSRLAGVVGKRTLDLIVLNDVPPQFARRIVTEGLLIHCSDPEAAHAFVRDVQLLAADLDPFLNRMRGIKIEGLRPS